MTSTTANSPLKNEVERLLASFGIDRKEYLSETGMPVRSPIDGGRIANVRTYGAADVEAAVGIAHERIVAVEFD